MAIVINTAAAVKQIAAMKKQVETALLRGSRKLAAAMVRDAKQNAPKSTGDLRRRIRGKVTDLDGARYEVTAGVGTGVGGTPLIYARIQDLGGLIRPKTAQKLAIPVHPAFFTKAGVGGVRARDVISKPKSYGFRSTYTSENAIIGVPNYLNGQPKPEAVVLFIRVESVFIYGNRYLQDARIEGTRKGPAILLAEVNRALGVAIK